MSRKLRKKENRLLATEQKLLNWYSRNTRSRQAWNYFKEHGNPFANRNLRLYSEFTARYAKPAYDALVQRIREHKEEVKGFRR